MVCWKGHKWKRINKQEGTLLLVDHYTGETIQTEAYSVTIIQECTKCGKIRKVRL